MEKAGLALRVFPLLIKRLQIWSDTTDRIKDIKHYKRVLQRLVRQLNMEKCKFENICGLLVEGIASTEDEATLLQGHGWQDPKFQVKERLRPAQAMAFDDALETLTCCLQELGHAVGLVEDREPLEETVSKTQWKKIRLMLREESHTSLLDKINKINFDLFHLTMQRPSSTGIRSATRQPPAARNYNRIRSHAKSLYSILQEKFQTTMCTCRLPHNAGLKLEKATVDGADQADIRLEVFFDFETVQGISHVEKEWRALEFEPVERDSIIQKSHASDDMKSGVQRSDMGNPGPTSEETEGPAPVRELTLIGNRTARFAVLRSIGKRPKKAVSFMEPSSRIEANKVSVIEASKRVDNLCSVIQNTATDRSNSCIGILFDECNQPYRIWPTMTLSPYSPQPEAVSLESLLVHGALEKRDRLELGAQLASAVMQFHSTEWLNDCWGKQDIFFLQKAVHQRAVAGGVVLVHEPVIDKPFVRRTFGSSKELYPLRSNTLQNNTPTTLVEHDRSLFSLGIMLIELWFERRIEDLRTPSQNHDCDIQSQSSDNVNYQTARDCLGEIFIYAGEDYGVAVSRCINGFNIPIGNTQAISGSLDNDDFKNDVHTNVVCLLEKNLKLFLQAYPK